MGNTQTGIITRVNAKLYNTNMRKHVNTKNETL